MFRTIVGTMIIWLITLAAIPVQAQETTTVAAVAEKVQQYRTSLLPISGRLLVSYYYGERAIEAEQGKAKVLAGAGNLPAEPHWSRYGCVYCEFTMLGDSWIIRAARLVNSGFGELGILPGYAQAQPEPELRPDLMPAQYEFCDGARVVTYSPTEGTARVNAFTDRSEYSGMRRQLQELLLVQRGILPAEKVVADYGGRIAELEGGVKELSRVRSSEGELSKGQIRVDPNRDWAIVGYQALGIREDRPEVGARWVVDAFGEAVGDDAVWLPKTTVKHIFLYAPDRNPWHSTTVAEWIDLQVGKTVKWPGLLDLVVPLGTYLMDPGRLTGPRDGQAPGFRAGHLDDVPNDALQRKGSPPGYDETFARPIGAADLAALEQEGIY